MFLKSFKFSNSDLVYSYKTTEIVNDTPKVITKSYDPTKTREALINKYINIVKSKTSLSDDKIDIKISVLGDSIQYDITFQGINVEPEITSDDWKSGIIPDPDDPTPDPDPDPDPDPTSVTVSGRVITYPTLRPREIPVQDATVCIKISDENQTLTTTDASGNFSVAVAGLNDKFANIIVSTSQYETKTKYLNGLLITCSAENPTIEDPIVLNWRRDLPEGTDSTNIILGGYVVDASYEPFPLCRVTLYQRVSGTSDTYELSNIYATTNAAGFFSFTETQLRSCGDYSGDMMHIYYGKYKVVATKLSLDNETNETYTSDNIEYSTGNASAWRTPETSSGVIRLRFSDKVVGDPDDLVTDDPSTGTDPSTNDPTLPYTEDPKDKIEDDIHPSNPL